MSLLDELDGSIEEEKQISTKRDSSIDQRVGQITTCFDKWLGSYNFLNGDDYNRALRGLKGINVQPEDIEIFASRLKHQNIIGKLTEKNCGDFFTALIKRSYLNGYNGFNLKLNEELKNIEFIGEELVGKKNNPIKITIEGDGAYNWFNESKYCSITFNGNVKSSVNEVKYSTIVFNGDMTYDCGIECENCNIIINGKEINDSIFNNINCDMTLNYSNTINTGFYSENSRFYSSDINILNKTSLENENDCSYYLIEKDGSHKKVTFK